MEDQDAQAARKSLDQENQVQEEIRVECAVCGHTATDAFSELGTLSAYRAVAIEHDGGKFVLNYTSGPELDDAQEWESEERYMCSYCGHEARTFPYLCRVFLSDGSELVPPNPNQTEFDWDNDEQLPRTPDRLERQTDFVWTLTAAVVVAAILILIVLLAVKGVS